MFTAILQKLTARENLTTGEAADAMTAIMSGRATPATIAAFLVGLAMKGERPEEIVGLAETMRREAVPFETARPPRVRHVRHRRRPLGHLQHFDRGRGGDRRMRRPRCEARQPLGVEPVRQRRRARSPRPEHRRVPAVAERCLADAGIAFLFAPTFHPSMRHAGPTRRELGLRTAFNLLGPLTNPARPTRQLVGVPRPELTQLLARSLQLLGSERAWVVHGADGIDEISSTGYTKVSECRAGSVRTFYVHPSDFGLRKAPLEALAGGDAADNAAIIRRVLAGGTGAPRDAVVLDAGVGLFVAGHVASISAGIATAAAAIDSGRAAATLARLAELSHSPVGEPA